MNPFDLITFPDPTALAEGVAADWLALTAEAGQGAGFQLVALSGGRIANGFLAAAATQERQALLEKARQEATGRRTQALAELQTARAAARADLMAQVDALADSMVAHLLREA